MNKNGIIVFLKYPYPGGVKTRIASYYGDEFAAELYDAFVRDILVTLEKVSAEKLIYHESPADIINMQRWLGMDNSFFRQSGADLGEKMRNAFQEQFKAGYEKLVIIGTDIPYIESNEVEEAFDFLGNYDAVIGPSKDGGYYLVGFREATLLKDIFCRMPWSTEVIYKRTMKIFREYEYRTKKLKKVFDIDLPKDVRSLFSMYKKGKFRGKFTSTFFENHKI